MSKLKELARKIAGTSPLEVGRKALTTEEIAGKPLTIRDYDFIDYEGTDGNPVHYAMVIFDEIEDGFYRCGQQLTEILTDIECEGMHGDVNTEGLTIALTLKKTKSGNNFTAVSIL